ncbi:hypothetical protein HN51_050459 [Arachis hypogaea]|uniref:Ferritin n=1 Tax=Arachis hypogaea TaxID=3818 RepID=A0A444YB45_ARAHY|nr:ferritin-4, chloroplastic-like [Arachis ipaensis]XP_025669034.1 ferritin-4, chloroplastic [Arachis hypogaea]QHN92214.1 Ferritin-3 [Arachis hypogaea]RYQ99171.1 hypothetical protein Ahy_B07g087061 [Arachis hypogaea]
MVLGLGSCSSMSSASLSSRPQLHHHYNLSSKLANNNVKSSSCAVRRKTGGVAVVKAAAYSASSSMADHGNNKAVLGIVFKPFEEVKKELLSIPKMPHQSLARQGYSSHCEAALNAQINVEYNVSYVYHAMYAYFDRDNVALKGFAKYFKESSMEERQHAEIMMEYQNKRGGRVKLESMLMPFTEFDHAEKGDALNAMELALSLERLNNEKLLNLHKIATQNKDVQLADFIESEFLVGQVEDIKKISEYVAELRRLGKGHGVWHFDQMLLNGGVAA